MTDKFACEGSTSRGRFDCERRASWKIELRSGGGSASYFACGLHIQQVADHLGHGEQAEFYLARILTDER